MSKFLKILGNILIFLGLLMIGVDSFFVLFSNGVWAFIKFTSPFNLSNLLAIIIVLAPGVICSSIGDYLED
jgi:hypothetical protein